MLNMDFSQRIVINTNDQDWLQSPLQPRGLRHTGEAAPV